MFAMIFITVITTNDLAFPIVISHGWVVKCLDPCPTVSTCTFPSWFFLLCAALAFLISIKKIFKSPPNCFDTWGLRINSFEKYFGNFSDPTLNYYQNLELYRFKKTFIWERKYPTWYSMLILFTNIEGPGTQIISSSREQNSKTHSTQTVWHRGHEKRP